MTYHVTDQLATLGVHDLLLLELHQKHQAVEHGAQEEHCRVHATEYVDGLLVLAVGAVGCVSREGLGPVVEPQHNCHCY